MAVDPSTTYTIADFIDAAASTDITYQKLSLVDTVGDIEFPVFNVINDYLDEFKNLAVTVSLNDSDYQKYAYRPRILANDIYGNGDLYFIILLINNICNIKEFNMKKIKMLKQSDMSELITMIYNAEKHYIDTYNSK